MNTIDLTLSRKQLEVVSEISMQEWMDHYNALCKEFGSCFGPHRGSNFTKCVEVRWFDTVETSLTHFDLSSCYETDSYGEDAWMNEDILKLIEGKTLTIKNGGFDLEVTERVYGLEFVTVDGKIVRDHIRRIPLWKSGNYRQSSQADKKDLGIHFLQFDNNPRRLAIETERFRPDNWSEDYCPCYLKDEVFCLQRVISLLPCEIETLLNSEEMPETCKGCAWTSCPVFKKFNNK